MHNKDSYNLKHIIQYCIEKGLLIEDEQPQILNFLSMVTTLLPCLMKQTSFYPQDDIVPSEFVHNNQISMVRFSHKHEK